MNEIVEKIKQKAKLGTEIENMLDTDVMDEWRYAAKTQWVKLDDVLKILSGYTIMEKQKIRELADLLKNRPRNEKYLLSGKRKGNRTCSAKYEELLEKVEKFVDVFGVESETEKIMKDKKLLKAFKKGSHCSPYKPLVESTKKETTTQEEDIESEKEFEKWEKESKP